MVDFSTEMDMYVHSVLNSSHCSLSEDHISRRSKEDVQTKLPEEVKMVTTI